jgi:hypothetical protein
MLTGRSVRDFETVLKDGRRTVYALSHADVRTLANLPEESAREVAQKWRDLASFTQNDPDY